MSYCFLRFVFLGQHAADGKALVLILQIYSISRRQQEDAEINQSVSPSVEMLEDGIAVITLPPFNAQGNDEMNRYATAVLDALPESLPGAVIDLRGNTGDNMYPMCAAALAWLREE